MLCNRYSFFFFKIKNSPEPAQSKESENHKKEDALIPFLSRGYFESPVFLMLCFTSPPLKVINSSLTLAFSCSEEGRRWILI